MDTNKLKTDNTMYRCEDCDLTVHRNDKEKHLSGGRHKYKIRQKTNERRNEELQFECNVCDSKFTNMDFYTIHIGSKTHKRNLRKIKKPLYNKKGTDKVGRNAMTDTTFKPTARRVPIQGIDKYITLDDLKDPCHYRSIREKYRPKNMKNHEGHNKTYVSSVTAYWAVSLALDPAVQDFKICLNDKEWGDFGDAVIEIQFNETPDQPIITTTFAIQFKHISNNVKSIDSLSEGRFDTAKYISQISKVKGQSDIENKKFVLYTTANTQADLQQSFKLKTDVLHRGMMKCSCSDKDSEVPVVAKTLSNRRKHVVNTSDDNTNIYFFFSTDNIHVVPKFYLYTHQKKLKNLARSIDDTVSDKLEDKRVDIHRDFIKYVEYWSEGFLGGNYKLKKEDVLVKLGHLLLYEFRVLPQVNKVIENLNYGIWNQAVNSVDVTILTKHPVVLFKICSPINAKIEKELALNIDTTNTTLKITQTNISNIQNTVLKMYLFEETLGDIHDDIPLEIVYDVFWKAGLIPMILEVKDAKHQDHVLQVIGLLKSLGLIRKYFLKTSDPNIKSSLKYYKTLSFFASLDDVAHKLPSFLLDYVKISITDTFSLSLKRIQDSDLFFQKKVSPHEFFDMSLGKYSFKSIGNQLARREEGVEDAKLVLDDSMMQKLKEEIESKNEMDMIMKDKHNSEKRWLRGINPDIFF